jgi:vitamin B12 transporter
MKKHLIAALCAASLGSLAEETNLCVVVSATRTPIELEQVGSSLSVVTAEDAERYQLRTAADAVTTTPGVTFNQTGGLGQPSSVYIRGSKSEHVKIYIDGIPVNDPTVTAGQADLAHLNTDNIEQIEVLRGAQSTLYGSDAIGGVINIRTQKGSGDPTHYIDMEAGSYNTLRTAAGSSGGNDLVDYSVSLSRTETDGYSALNGSDESDGYKNTTLHTRIGINPLDNAGLEFIFRHVNTEGDYDDTFAINPPADQSVYDTDENYFRAQGHLDLFEGLWQQKAGVSLHNIDRDYSWGGYNGQTIAADWQNDIFINEMNLLTAGLEWEQESYHDSFGGKYNDESIGLYLQDQIFFTDNLIATVGARHEEHQQAGSADTYRLTGSYRIDATGTRLKATLGTGFRSPSLYQLYAPYGTGNSSLTPEKSRSWDIGFEQPLVEGKLAAGMTYFQNHLQDTISYDYSLWTYVQSSDVDTYGVETFLDWTPSDKVTVHLNHTWMNIDDKDAAGYAELRKPKHEINARLDLQATDKLNLFMLGSFVGERTDTGSVTLDPYITLDVGGGYQMTSNLLIYARIENITDEDYELVDGYGTAGISAYAGAKFIF